MRCPEGTAAAAARAAGCRSAHLASACRYSNRVSGLGACPTQTGGAGHTTATKLGMASVKGAQHQAVGSNTVTGQPLIKRRRGAAASHHSHIYGRGCRPAGAVCRVAPVMCAAPERPARGAAGPTAASSSHGSAAASDSRPATAAACATAAATPPAIQRSGGAAAGVVHTAQWRGHGAERASALARAPIPAHQTATLGAVARAGAPRPD
jgi:hypothetical protein